jgi:hypothetical protein
VLQLKNTTPFPAAIALLPNEEGIDSLCITMKATFQIGGKPAVAAEQRALVLADEYWGEPGMSSIKYASESHLAKPSTDVILVGEAIAPRKRPVSQIDVTLAVADRKKTVRVFGDRSWKEGLVGASATSPVPFVKMPLVYERAFGGAGEADPEKSVPFEPRNPVGCGYVGRRWHRKIEGVKLPNLEDPENLISGPGDQPPPAGFGCIAPSWEPRRSFAGTYDEAWERNRAPFLPKDFNPRFFNMAHPDLVCSGYLEGGESVEVINASDDGPLRFRLPACRAEASVLVSGAMEKPPLNLETVLLEPGSATLCMTWRAILVCGRKAPKVRQIELALQQLDPAGKAA